MATITAIPASAGAGTSTTATSPADNDVEADRDPLAVPGNDRTQSLSNSFNGEPKASARHPGHGGPPCICSPWSKAPITSALATG